MAVDKMTPLPDRSSLATVVLGGGAGVIPVLYALGYVPHVSPATHDTAVVRVVGLGWTGLFRALDAWTAAPWMLLPLGSRSWRASLASAATVGLASFLLYRLLYPLFLCTHEEEEGGLRAPPWFWKGMACCLVLTVALSWPWQREAISPGGGGLGAALLLAPLARLSSARRWTELLWVQLVFLVVLGLAYEPLVGLGGFLSVCVFVVGDPSMRKRPPPLSRSGMLHCVMAGGLGVLPSLFALGRRRAAPWLAQSSPPWAAWAGESGGGDSSFVREALGALPWPVLGVALVGFVLGIASPQRRGLTLAFGGVAVWGWVAEALGAPAEAARYGGTILAALAMPILCAGIAIQMLLRVVGSTTLPLSVTRFRLVLCALLLLAFPCALAERTGEALQASLQHPPAEWEAVAWGSLPPGTRLLVDAPLAEARLLAGRASGTLRGDLLFLPIFSDTSALALWELRQEAQWVPLWRDRLLMRTFQESSLAALASRQPLAFTNAPQGTSSLFHHLFPSGLVIRFFPELRTPAERHQAWSLWLPSLLALKPLVQEDPALHRLTTHLLEAQAHTLRTSGAGDVTQQLDTTLAPLLLR